MFENSVVIEFLDTLRSVKGIRARVALKSASKCAIRQFPAHAGLLSPGRGLGPVPREENRRTVNLNVETIRLTRMAPRNYYDEQSSGLGRDFVDGFALQLRN